MNRTVDSHGGFEDTEGNDVLLEKLEKIDEGDESLLNDRQESMNSSNDNDFDAEESMGSEGGASKEIRYSHSLGMPGIARINLSPLTQKIVGCVIGENVTTEYPWIDVKKEIIEDNLDLHSESSDFLPIREQINDYPEKNMLIGYAPTSSKDEGQFYICLTETGREAAITQIEELRVEREERVRNAVYKKAGKWRDLGSSKEIDESIVKNTRDLIEIEVNSTLALLNRPIKLSDRNADDQRDGYVELLAHRETFDNVTRSQVSRGDQAGFPVRDNDVQTTEPSLSSILVKSWPRYCYEYEPINTKLRNEDQTKAIERSVDGNTGHIRDKLLHTNDDAKIDRSKIKAQPPVPMTYTEYQSYYDGKLTKDKVINDLSWHPLWTGIAVVAYTDRSKSDHCVGDNPGDEVLRASQGDNQVLVWSLNDCLNPKLVLQCPREVTAVSICPLDGNIVVGGCASGQVVLWSINGKIEEVESVTVLTPTQVKNRMRLKSLMQWMKDTKNSSVVEPTAMSSLQHSQSEQITQIVWLPAYNKIDKNGRITSLPKDTKVEDLGWQFATSSEDGTIAFWDLRWRPTEGEMKKGSRNKGKTDKRRKKRMMTMMMNKKTAMQPNALVQNQILKTLDGTFRPEYILQVNYPGGEERRVFITTMSLYRPNFRREPIESSSLITNEISVRKYYKFIYDKPDHEMKPSILIGTLDGDVAIISWEGYDFATGLTVNRESAKSKFWCTGIHDGPVTHSVRSKYLNDVFVTVGGMVFGIWREDFDEPIFWRRSVVRYTACCWGTFRPTVVILGRVDGTIEIWDFIVKSHEPSFAQSLSGRIITGIYTHELYLNPQCVAFCDFNGALRVFTAPKDLLVFNETDIEWMRNFVDHEVIRIREFKAWQKNWNETNMESIEKRKKEAELEIEKKRLEAEEKIKMEMAEMMSKQKPLKTGKSKRKPGEFLEEARKRWSAMELKRMQRVILEKKGLRGDILEKQRAPVLEILQDAKRKKGKLKEIIQLKDKIFEDSVAFIFPEQRYHDRKHVDLPRKSELEDQQEKIDDNDEDENQNDESTAVKAILNEEAAPKFVDPKEEIIREFMEIQSEALATIKKNPYKPKFEWRKLLREGQIRRRSMDVELKRNDSRKSRELLHETPEALDSTTDRNI